MKDIIPDYLRRAMGFEDLDSSSFPDGIRGIRRAPEFVCGPTSGKIKIGKGAERCLWSFIRTRICI